jgi:hypothetical protein
MKVREASCRCGGLRVRCTGEPVRVSVCHCLDCQRRSGSAFAVQARFPANRVTVTGQSRGWTHVADSGREACFHFCPECGSQVYYTGGGFPDLIAVPVGAFADPTFPAPAFSVWEVRRHPWVQVNGDEIERFC